jgi:hypothetical protein
MYMTANANSDRWKKPNTAANTPSWPNIVADDLYKQQKAG